MNLFIRRKKLFDGSICYRVRCGPEPPYFWMTCEMASLLMPWLNSIPFRDGQILFFSVGPDDITITTNQALTGEKMDKVIPVIYIIDALEILPVEG